LSQSLFFSFNVLTRDKRKRARYDSGEDLVDMSDMFGGGGRAGPGGIDPEIILQMMGQNGGFGGGGFGGGGAGGFPGGISFNAGGGGGGRQRGQGFPGGSFPGGFNFS
jgi:DnaJ homolog subfamily C member 7